MADIPHLADKAVQIYRSSKATSWKSAAQKAVKRSGVISKPDIERIASEICRELQKRATAARMAKKRRKKEAVDKKSREPRQLRLL